MNDFVSDDPLERLIARFDVCETGEPPEMIETGRGDPLERLGDWIVAARDLSVDTGSIANSGVLSELKDRIESAHVLDPIGELELRATDPADPRRTIAMWIRDEGDALGSVSSIQRVREARDNREGVVAEYSVEAAVGRAVLMMIGNVPLAAKSRKKAVELLARAMEQPSSEALQDVFRILIAGE